MVPSAAIAKPFGAPPIDPIRCCEPSGFMHVTAARSSDTQSVPSGSAMMHSGRLRFEPTEWKLSVSNLNVAIMLRSPFIVNAAHIVLQFVSLLSLMHLNSPGNVVRNCLHCYRQCQQHEKLSMEETDDAKALFTIFNRGVVVCRIDESRLEPGAHDTH